MAYILRRKARPADEIRRVLLAQNRKAHNLLTNWREAPAAHIHQSRQAFKKIRATLWLLRPDHRYVYDVENRAYRDLASQLAYARDGSAMVEAADRLAERIWEPGARQSLLMLRRSLAEQAAQETADAIAGMDEAVESVRAELPDLAARLAKLPLGKLRRRDLRHGARRTLARAERNYRRLDANSPPELFHDWRKHVKYAFYQSGLMAELAPRRSRRLRPVLQELGELLGQAQDLHMLDRLITAQPDALGIDLHWRQLRRRVGQAQAEMHGQAAMLGRQLFDDKVRRKAAVVEMPQRARRG
jgi:hypothetical protein